MTSSPDTHLGRAGQIADILLRHPDPQKKPFAAAIVGLVEGGPSEAREVYNSRHRDTGQNVGDFGFPIKGIIMELPQAPSDLVIQPEPPIMAI